MTFHAVDVLRRAHGFLARQKRNYRVAIVRSAGGSFLGNLTAQYDSIYTTALGANSVELGAISSIGAAISALLSTPIGWLMDRHGIKRLYLIGIALLAGGALTYALAGDWRVIFGAVLLLAVSMRLMGTGCSVICRDSVKNEDRVTAQNVCVTVASAFAMVAPLLAAPLITASGGMTVEGIRPLYYIRFAGYGVILVFVAVQLREPLRRREQADRVKSSFVGDFGQLFSGTRPLGRWIGVAVLTGFPMAMISPFFQLFAHEVKGADQYLLAGMITAAILTRLVFGIPLGRLADKIGRKKVIYLITPLWYASNILLVLSFSPVTLILAGALQTFYAISAGATNAMTLELVPVSQVGRWSGLLGLFRGLVAIPAPILGGLIWKELGPAYVFVIPVVLDSIFRIPLLSTIPETLKS